MDPVTLVVGGVAAAAAAPGLLAAAHLGTLAAASLAYREPRPDVVTTYRYLVLIPAHDEEAVIGATLRAVNAVLRDGDEVLVVADRCSDDTAAIARRHGARVLERQPGEEPGRAAARQAGVEAARGLEWDAIVMIDADSIVEPGFLDACDVLLSTGAQALQARSESIVGPSLVNQAQVAGFALQGVLIPRGRDRLGLLVRLRGTGMVLTRAIVEQHRFRAAAGEDRWYGLDLCLAGIRPRHVESARLRSASVTTWSDAAGQRMRYEAGRMSGAREFVGALLRRRTPIALEAAVDLVTPPFAVAVASLVAGGALGWIGGAPAVTWVALAGLTVLALVLATGLLQARVTARTWGALLAAPAYIAWKLVVQFRALASVQRGDRYYPPTPRR